MHSFRAVSTHLVASLAHGCDDVGDNFGLLAPIQRVITSGKGDFGSNAPAASHAAAAAAGISTVSVAFAVCRYQPRTRRTTSARSQERHQCLQPARP